MLVNLFVILIALKLITQFPRPSGGQVLRVRTTNFFRSLPGYPLDADRSDYVVLASHRSFPKSHDFRVPGFASSIAKYSAISFSCSSSR